MQGFIYKEEPMKVTDRVLIYSHDSFGLGHLRRCRAIAHALVQAHKNLSVLIISGSPIIGSFDFRPRVDFIRIPGVIKRSNGSYTPLKLHIDITDTLNLRASIIRHTAESFRPNLFIVDKEPLGLKGEVRQTLEFLKSKKIPLVLGLRDVMDSPDLLAPEWERKKALPALENLYDDIWVYGLPSIYEPLKDLDISKTISKKLYFTGYIKRHLSKALKASPLLPQNIRHKPYILVTPGGGGDGDLMIDWVLRACETGQVKHPILIVFGPFLAPQQKVRFLKRIKSLPPVAAITFEPYMERLLAKATGVVAMGGYNTFCEILSFDKPALIIPRTKPRMEQYIRATKASNLGLVTMLDPQYVHDTQKMITALQNLREVLPPSHVDIKGLLDGLPNITQRALKHIEQGRKSSLLRQSPQPPELLVPTSPPVAHKKVPQ